MAHFAQLDDSNTVLRVIVVGNDCCLDDHGNESEEVGAAFCRALFGSETRWIQTSYNANFRGLFAGIGYWYDDAHDVFVMPILDTNSSDESPTQNDTNIPA